MSPVGVSAVSLIPGSFLRLNSHFLICETTNIFFNIAWVLRAAGYKGNAIVLIFEYLFALSFFPIRILNLTTAIWVLQEKVTNIPFSLYIYPLFMILSHIERRINLLPPRRALVWDLRNTRCTRLERCSISGYTRSSPCFTPDMEATKVKHKMSNSLLTRNLSEEFQINYLLSTLTFFSRSQIRRLN